MGDSASRQWTLGRRQRILEWYHQRATNCSDCIPMPWVICSKIKLSWFDLLGKHMSSELEVGVLRLPRHKAGVNYKRESIHGVFEGDTYDIMIWGIHIEMNTWAPPPRAKAMTKDECVGTFQTEWEGVQTPKLRHQYQCDWRRRRATLTVSSHALTWLWWRWRIMERGETEKRWQRVNASSWEKCPRWALMRGAAR